MERATDTQESMASAVLILAASALIMLAVLLLACGVCFAQEGTPATPFPLPQQLTRVRDGISLSDLTALRTALNADHELTQAEDRPPAYSPDQFGELNVSRVDLGPLGSGLVVYFDKSGACGATGNCPMALYIRQGDAFRPALHFGGWGSWTIPAAAGPPYVVSAWNMSCCDEFYNRYAYRHGQYVADACAEGLTNPGSDDPEKMSWKACQPGSPTFIPPANMQAPESGGPTYKDLQQLRSVVSPDLKSISATAFSSLPVIALPHWFVMGVPSAAGLHLFVYPRLRKGIGQAVLRDVDADFAAETETQEPVNPSEPPPLIPIPALILASRRGNTMELRLYTEPGSDQTELPPNGHMQLDACGEATPKSGDWPVPWNLDALRLHAIPCAQK